MKNKILSLSVLVFSFFIFSACTLNKNQITQEKQADSPQVVQETGDDTEEELLNQLNADKDTNFDSELNSLQTEIAN